MLESDQFTAPTAKPLDADQFFYVGRDNYDDIAERSLPHYAEGHEAIARIVRARVPHAQVALDLGTGSGFTALTLLNCNPALSVTGLDLFPSMLAHARDRLEQYGSRAQLVAADNTAWLRANPQARFDVISSAFCIHHLDAAGKRELFGLVANALRPGGIFVMMDLTTFSDGVLKGLARTETQAYMLDHVSDEATRREWLHHWNHVNIPDPLDDMVEWLRLAGLRAETVCRWWEVGVVVAGLAAG